MWLPAVPLRNRDRNRGQPAPRPAQGLTLVELLLAITLFSLLMAATSWLVLSATRVQETWESSAEPYDELERALTRLEEDLASAQPFFGIPVVVEPQRVELGRVGQLAASAVDSSPDWLRITYRLTTDDAGLSLVRQEYLWRKDGSGAGPLREETLVHLASGQFAFGSVDATTGQLKWLAGWDGKKNGLPRLVKFDCAMRAADGRPPVPLSRIVRNPAGTLPTTNTP